MGDLAETGFGRERPEVTEHPFGGRRLLVELGLGARPGLLARRPIGVAGQE